MATFTGTDADEIITPETVSATVTASDGAEPSTLADVIYAGGGNDLVAGGGGNDIVDLGAGDDRFIWNPGDGSDTINGGSGVDTLEVQGSAAAELVEISSFGGDARFYRNIGSVTLSLHDVESIEYTAIDGQDSTTVNDLSARLMATLRTLVPSGQPLGTRRQTPSKSTAVRPPPSRRSRSPT